MVQCYTESSGKVRESRRVHATEDAVLPLEGGQGAALPRDREHPLLRADGEDAELLALHAAAEQ